MPSASPPLFEGNPLGAAIWVTSPWACDTPKAVKSAYFTLIAFCAIAQTVGLPQYGVLLEGTADAPVLINNSPHRILAYALQYDNTGFSTYNMLRQFRTQPTSSGIAPGAIGRIPVPAQVRDVRGLPVQHTYVALDAVLFDDGHVLGPDKGGMFDGLASQIKAEQEIAAILLNATDLRRGHPCKRLPPHHPSLPHRAPIVVAVLVLYLLIGAGWTLSSCCSYDLVRVMQRL